MIENLSEVQGNIRTNFSTKFLSLPLKWCGQCNHLLPTSDFYLNGNCYRTPCKACQKKNGASYHVHNRIAVAQRHQDYAQRHQKEIAIYQCAYNKQYPEKARARQVRYRARHHDDLIVIQQEQRISLKSTVLDHYGPACVLCGESIKRFLCIDHVDGRKQCGHDRGMRGNRLYRWLKANNYPQGFRTLCHNCNMRLAYYGHDKQLGTSVQQYRAQYRVTLRAKVIGHYSNQTNQCACCKESDMRVLGIDHINGGGNKHRDQIGKDATYLWLVKNHYPAGFQVLCHNCNIAKGSNGHCPHEGAQA